MDQAGEFGKLATNYLIETGLSVSVLLAAAWDLRFRKIPNWLTLSSMVTGIGVNALCHGWRGLQSGLLGCLTGIGLLFLFYLMRGMAAGDVKMLGAAGAFLGPRLVFFAFIWMALAGGVLAIILMVWKKAGRRTWGNLKDLILSWILRIPPREANLTLQNPSLIKLPYGVPIAIGAILAAWLRWIPGL